MMIRCLHGYFILTESRAGEVSDFASLFGLDLSAKDDYFTFTDLIEAPEYSLTGQPYLSGVATKHFEGKPWEVFAANSLIYDFEKRLVVQIQSTMQVVSLDVAGNYFLSPGLILPGSLTEEGQRIKDYAAWFSTDTMKWRYSEVSIVEDT